MTSRGSCIVFTVMETVRYTYRLRLSKTSRRALEAEWNLCRFVWNNCVGRERELRQEGFKTPSGYDLCSELTDWRGRHQWLRTGSQNVQQNTVLSWGKNRQAAFKVKGRRPPKFKSKHRALPTLEYTTNGFKLKDGRLVLAGGISCVVVWHRELPSVPKTVTVSRTADGHWQASFVVKREPEQWPEADGRVGIDWGVKAVAIASDEQFDLPCRNHLRSKQKKLKTVQQKMARRKRPKGQPSSAGYQAARVQFAKLHAQVARQRKHDARQWARKVVTENQLIAVEDFKPKFLSKSTMARKAADNSVGMVKAELVRYATQAGRTVVLVPPAYTTRTCSGCGTRAKTALTLKDRTFVCSECGLIADRDRNAARRILVLAETNQRSVEDVRHEGLLSGV